MNIFISKYWKIILSVFFGVAVFIFWDVLYPCYLSYQEQFQLHKNNQNPQLPANQNLIHQQVEGQETFQSASQNADVLLTDFSSSQPQSIQYRAPSSSASSYQGSAQLNNALINYLSSLHISNNSI